MAIYNKSSHPVEIKKISIRLWSLRDEIEAAVGRRIKECEAAGIPLFIDDIKKFYNMNLEAPLTDASNVLQMPGKDGKGEGLDSLMESLGEESKTEESKPEGQEAQEAKPEETKPEEPKAEGEAVSAEENKSDAPNSFNQAEEILAKQTLEGLENKSPNPILIRPYQRQAPDLDKVSYGFSLLSDINMTNILSFTKERFLQGQSVVVEFLIPQSFIMTAEVSYCHYYALRSRIISSTKPDYRVQCKFTYAFPGERENLRNFLKSIEPTVRERKRPEVSAEDDSLET